MLLAGGGSRRFGGRPKGLAEVGGRRIADRILDALSAATDTRMVVANDPDAASWFPGRLVIPDARHDVGPLGGLEVALAAARGASVLVVAWDMPFVTAALLHALRSHAGAGVDAVVPVHGSARDVEPLCAWYAPSALAVCRALLDAGERRARALPASLSMVRALGDEELARLGDPSQLLTSVDTASDLETARLILERAPAR